MNLLLTGTEGFLGWLWRASWQASAVLGLVLLAQWVLRHHLAPRWRHALWLLVVVRLALPGSVQSPLSLFNWWPATRPLAASPAPASAAVEQALGTPTGSEGSGPQGASFPGLSRPWLGLAGLWLAGAGALTLYLLLTSWRLGRRVRRERPVTQSAVLELLEDCKEQMGLRTPLTVVETAAVKSPSLFGFVRPRLLLPSGLIGSFSRAELRFVFLHELSHIKRGDIALNWLSAVPLVLHWFNPLVWFALRQMRIDGELACDALALAHTRESENRPYGQTILKLLERFGQPAAAAPGLVGLLENNHQMKRRIRMIAHFKKTPSLPVPTLLLMAALAAVTLTDAQTSPEQPIGTSAAEPQGPPQIVATSPNLAESQVDPTLSELSVTFNQDMQGGCSWTGGGPDFPPGFEGKKPRWRDARTCVLAVKLEAGHFYRVGINSTSFQNFRSKSGQPARPWVLYFTTQGASEETQLKLLKPQVVGANPLHEATDVDPALNQLTLSFNGPMAEGFSWTGSAESGFPSVPEGRGAYWSADHKTCVLPVELKPGCQYHLGLNSPSHNNFQSASGVPLEPHVYSFRTRP